MELPLANVLAKMEMAGIKVDGQTLNEMAVENQAVIDKLTQDIYEMAGEEFNINSPKQLGVILFEKWVYLWNTLRKPRQVIQRQWMSWTFGTNCSNSS